MTLTENTAVNMAKATTLYDDNEIVLEKFDNGTYRVTLFNKSLHWAGDITFDRDGIICDELTKQK